VLVVVGHLPATLAAGVIHPVEFVLEMLRSLTTDLIILVVEANRSHCIFNGVMNVRLDLDA